MTEEKLVPTNTDAEEAVLASILIDPDWLGPVAAILDPGDFSRTLNREVYEACLSVGDNVDQLTVSAELEKKGCKVDPGYLSLIVSRLPTSLNAEYYAGIVAHLALCRRLITAAGKIAAVAYQTAEDPLDKSMEILASINRGSHERVIEPYANAEAMAQRYTAPPEARDNGVPFGFRDLDAATGNMFGGEQIIFGGNTSMGKTQFIMGVALGNADNGLPVLYVSSEMQRDQWNDRVVAMETGMDVLYVRRRHFTPFQEKQVIDVIARVSERPVYFLPTSSFDHACRMARQLVSLKGVRLVIVDYLQQFSHGLGKAGGVSPYERVSYVSNGFKHLAMDLNIPVMAVSSISRDLLHRENKWPVLSDLRESGNIESDADLVMFIHRPGYYVAKDPEDDWTYISINKQRQGGHLRLGSDKQSDNRAIPLRWDRTKYVDAETPAIQRGMEL